MLIARSDFQTPTTPPTSEPGRHEAGGLPDPLDLDVEQKDADGYLHRIRRRTVAEVVDHIRAVLAHTEAGQWAEHDTVRLPLASPFPPVHQLIVHSRPGANEGDFIDVRALYYPDDAAPGVGTTWAAYSCKSYGAERTREAASVLQDRFWCPGSVDEAASVFTWWHEGGALTTEPGRALQRFAASHTWRRIQQQPRRERRAWLLDLPHQQQQAVRRAIHALGWPLARQALDLPATTYAPAGCEPAGAYSPSASFV